jgi:lysozyme
VSAEDLARRFEGCELEAYLCPAGIPTIGYGHTGKDVYLGLTWTAEQAEEELVHDLICADAQLTVYSPLVIGGNRAALTDFVFNLGIGNYRSSTLRTLVNEAAWPAVKQELLKWDHANGQILPGLLKRREAEAALIGYS